MVYSKAFKFDWEESIQERYKHRPKMVYSKGAEVNQ